MQRRHALTLLGATAGGLALTAALPAAACGLFPQASGLFSPASGWRFLVLRHGEPIGTQRMTFSRRGDDSVVEVAIDIAVAVLGITVFISEERRVGKGFVRQCKYRGWPSLS